MHDITNFRYYSIFKIYVNNKVSYKDINKKRISMNKFGLLFVILSLQTPLFAQKQLTLQDCRNLAIANNKQLKIGSEQVNKAEAEKRVAYSQYFPNISFTGSYLRNQKNISLLDSDRHLPIGTVMPDGSFGFTPSQVNNQWTEIGGNPVPLDANGQAFNPKEHPDKILWKEHTIIPKSEFDMDIKNVWAGSLSLIQPIYMGGKIRAYNQIANYANQLAESMNVSNLQEVMLKTDETYWQIISLENKYQLCESYVQLLQKMSGDVENLIEEGFATKADGLSVRVKLNEAEINQTKVENGLVLSKMLLCQLCGLELDEEIQLEDENVKDFPTSSSFPEIDMIGAFNSRPELRSLHLAKQIFEKKETIVKSEHLPTIAFAANYLVTNPNSFNGFHNDFGGMWNVGILVNIPIFHWGETHYKLKAAKTETRIKQLELDEAKEKISLQIKQTSFKSKEAYQKLLASTKNKESAEENLRYANLGFEEGIIPIFNVMEAQTIWVKAHSELIDAQVEIKLSEVYLNKALGKLDK
ncbi:alkaline protease [Bacteroidales bacterium]|nr:alkaline protease [Bacteroidales bacterium]